MKAAQGYLFSFSLILLLSVFCYGQEKDRVVKNLFRIRTSLIELNLKFKIRRLKPERRLKATNIG